MNIVKREEIKARDEALYEAYKEALSERGEVSHAEAIRKAIRSPQPHMWVSFYGVYRALLCIVRGSKEPPKNSARAHLLEEIKEKYNRLIKERIFKDSSLFFITSFIIAEPSKGFYVSENHAKKIVWRVRRERRATWKKRR